MAPSKSSNLVSNRAISLPRRSATTRTTQKQNVLFDGSQNILPQMGKRKADGSPIRNGKEIKRSALGNVTNAVLNAIDDGKKALRIKNDVTTTNTNSTVQKGQFMKQKTIQNDGAENHLQQPFIQPNQVPRPTKVVTRSSARAVEQIKTANLVATATAGVKKVSISTTIVKGKKKTELAQGKVIKSTAPDGKLDVAQKTNGRRISNEFDLMDNEDSHYMSALEDL